MAYLLLILLTIPVILVNGGFALGDTIQVGALVFFNSFFLLGYGLWYVRYIRGEYSWKLLKYRSGLVLAAVLGLPLGGGIAYLGYRIIASGRCGTVPIRLTP